MTVVLATTATAYAHSSTQDVWEHHLGAMEAHDIAAITEDYSEHSVVFATHKIYRGREEIAELFGRILGFFGSAQSFSIDPVMIHGKVAYATWHAQTTDADVEGADTLVVEDGKITYQSVTTDHDVFELN